MLIPIITWLIARVIATAVISAARILSIRTNKDREKNSPFECGFDPKDNARVPFSLRFFLLAIIFIVFDIEIALLLPVPLLNDFINTYHVEVVTLTFLVILLSGLFHEWKQGSLNWSS